MSSSASKVADVAVVGHTNTGKTSLLRTLARDARFGEVDDRPGTTREVRSIDLLAEEGPVLQLFDTPGLEDAVALTEHLAPGASAAASARARSSLVVA